MTIVFEAAQSHNLNRFSGSPKIDRFSVPDDRWSP
jgi:hypothetical protein